MNTFGAPLAGPFYANNVLWDPCESLYMLFVLRFVYLFSVTIAGGRSSLETDSLDAKRLFCGPAAAEDTYKVSAWVKLVRNDPYFHPITLLMFSMHSTAFPVIYAPYHIFANSVTRQGDQGMLEYLHNSHVAGFFFIICLIFYGLAMHFVLWPYLEHTVGAGSKHLISAETYKSRLKPFATHFRLGYTIQIYIVLAHTILMPHGMAMQAFGIMKASSWPSPTNYLFSNPGAAGNLIGTPVHFLLGKTFTTYLIARSFTF